jgi:hypothetical protein
MPSSLTAEEKRLRTNEYARKYRKLKKKKAEKRWKASDRQRERRAQIKLKNMNGIISTPSTRTPGDQPTPMATPVGKEIVSRSYFLSPREQWAVEKHEEQLAKADKKANPRRRGVEGPPRNAC